MCQNGQPERMRRFSKKIGAGICACASILLLAGAANASAATHTFYPSGQDNNTFRSNIGGWTDNTNYQGICVPGVTCAAATGNYVASNGVDQKTGLQDGYANVTFGGVASLGSSFVHTWNSPAFTVPASAGNKALATVRVQNNFTGLLPVDYTLYSRLNLVDEAQPNAPTNVAERTDKGSDTDWSYRMSSDVSSHIQTGHTYHLQVVTSLSGPLGVAVSGNIRYDNPQLIVGDTLATGDSSDMGIIDTTGGTGGSGGTGGNGGSGGNGSGNGTSGTVGGNGETQYGHALAACYKDRHIVVTTATPMNHHVRVTGVSEYVKGTKVTIRDQRKHKVGSATVASSGRWTANVTRPARSKQSKTVYHAVVGKATSPQFHLLRNNALQSTAVHPTWVKIKGQIRTKYVRGHNKVRIKGATGQQLCGSDVNKTLRTKSSLHLNKHTGRYWVNVKLTHGKNPLRIKTIVNGRHSQYVLR